MCVEGGLNRGYCPFKGQAVPLRMHTLHRLLLPPFPLTRRQVDARYQISETAAGVAAAATAAAKSAVSSAMANPTVAQVSPEGEPFFPQPGEARPRDGRVGCGMT